MAGAPLIEFKGVKKAFGAKVVYSHLDLAIPRGATVTIMGATCLAGDYEKVWEQKGVRKYTLKATRWAGFTPA